MAEKTLTLTTDELRVMKTVLEKISYALGEKTPEVTLKEAKPISGEDVKEIVTDYIRKIGTPAHLKGYQYLREAIIMVVEDPSLTSGITKILYPTIAKKYQTLDQRVERAIRNVVEVAWSRGSVEIQKSIFGYNSEEKEKKRPTNAEFIAMIADHVRMNHF